VLVYVFIYMLISVKDLFVYVHEMQWGVGVQNHWDMLLKRSAYMNIDTWKEGK